MILLPPLPWNRALWKRHRTIENLLRTKRGLSATKLRTHALQLRCLLPSTTANPYLYAHIGNTNRNTWIRRQYNRWGMYTWNSRVCSYKLHQHCILTYCSIHIHRNLSTAQSESSLWHGREGGWLKAVRTAVWIPVAHYTFDAHHAGEIAFISKVKPRTCGWDLWVLSYVPVTASLGQMTRHYNRCKHFLQLRVNPVLNSHHRISFQLATALSAKQILYTFPGESFRPISLNDDPIALSIYLFYQLEVSNALTTYRCIKAHFRCSLYCIDKCSFLACSCTSPVDCNFGQLHIRQRLRVTTQTSLSDWILTNTNFTTSLILTLLQVRS